MDARTLLIHADGQAELIGPRGNTLWASDSDETWHQQQGGDYMLDAEQDADKLIEYLIQEHYLTDEQAARLRLYEELERE